MYIPDELPNSSFYCQQNDIVQCEKYRKYVTVESGNFISDYFVFDSKNNSTPCVKAEMSPIGISEYCKEKGEHWYAASFRNLNELNFFGALFMINYQYLFNS